MPTFAKVDNFCSVKAMVKLIITW